MSTIVEVTEVDKISEHVKEILKHGCKLMQCLEELKDAKEDDYKKLASRYL
jgi:predicted peroxiredoxin